MFARLQFGLTTLYHFSFVPVSISLALYLAIMQTAWYRTGKPKYLKMVKFWSKPFLTADRATVLITHRLSALELVDEIIVLKNGGAAERGRHAIWS